MPSTTFLNDKNLFTQGKASKTKQAFIPVAFDWLFQA